jgi:hypothetical protein
MEYDKSYDEGRSIDDNMRENEERGKAHDSHENFDAKKCECRMVIGDEVFCLYTNNELNFCGELCPRMKGE